VARGNRWPQRRVEPPELTARRAGCYTPRFDDEDTVARKDDEAPDPTLGPHITPVNIGGDSILDRLAPHVMKFAVGAGALVVVIIAYYSWRWYDRSKAEKATSTLVRGLELGDRAVVAEPTPEDTEPSYPSYAARADATAAAIAKSGRARGAAALYEANLLLTAGKHDQALAAFRKLGTGTSDDAVLAREAIGVTLETQAAATKDQAAQRKLLEEALVAFRAVQSDDQGLRRDYALFHEARVLEALGKPAEAVAPLTKALTVAPETSLRRDIENRLVALGAPVPAPPAPEVMLP
jgi:tetratricopeptide (TPR) repeat protein